MEFTVSIISVNEVIKVDVKVILWKKMQLYWGGGGGGGN